ncbi:protein FAR1-RELATED SEQUENCE 5-like [Salvia miltiorrhiza]|uniref:protein FAR1-RELATED SEQUENCE 5-like n=1 Tax=Salvia miltiorrhiza TaxID=226208 RepID=UPI0025AB984E|nr:protein FAR1-RELATED SEQUENCE 5-like [Salvia miltiorrhiza]
MGLTDCLGAYTRERQCCIPACEESIKPYEGQVFDTLNAGVMFYKRYAAAVGFQARMSTIIYATDGSIRIRYVLCNREGVWDKADEAEFDPKNPKAKKRKTTSCRADCKARAIFQVSSGGVYKLRTFNEGHTHLMVPAHARHLMACNRKVGEFEQSLIISGIKANIGPMRTFRIYKEIMGTYEGIGCTGTDFKNYVRDLKVYSKDSDANMLIEALKNKQELGHGFRFFHDVDEEKRLRRLIWTDEIAIRNYELFGDAVSFDATYNTNRYKLIFTPFTGKDNHGKCVTFGGALISNEDMDSYSWVLVKFAELMGSAPRLIITDQDPGLRKAIASSWKETRHRFCMWHITMKLAEKLPSRLNKDPEFKTNFDNIVWSEFNEPDVFEEHWQNMIDEYDLADNRWFSDMFEDRKFWVPAYFRDISMSGIFRTTSSSESENSYFKRFMNKNADLVLLYTNYCSALDSQRYTYQQITLADETRAPKMQTILPIECHAAQVYTISRFKHVQDEIKAAMIRCVIRKMYSEEDDDIYVVADNVDGVFTVRHVKSQEYISCNCNHFITKGQICKHMFVVLKNLSMDTIPEKYLVKRWCKFSIMCPGEAEFIQPNGVPESSSKVEFRYFKVISEAIGFVRGNSELCEQLFSNLCEVKDKFQKLGSTGKSQTTKDRLFLEFYGSAPTDTPSVLPPLISKTKGSGAGGRRKSEQEKAMLLAQKPLRLCRRYLEVALSHYTQNTSGGKACVYRLYDYQLVLRSLKNRKDIECEEIPWGTFNVVQKFSHSFIVGRWIPCRPEHLHDEKVDGLISELPIALLNALLPFQLDGVRFGLRRGGRCLIADEMGLEKTLQVYVCVCVCVY